MEATSTYCALTRDGTTRTFLIIETRICVSPVFQLDISSFSIFITLHNDVSYNVINKLHLIRLQLKRD